MVANTKNREQLFQDFTNARDDEIYVISSWQVIKQCIVTKNANHVVFVDSKGSISSIIQNIGRIVRKNENTIRPSTVTIPCLIDYEKYRHLEDDLTQDDYIRKAIMEYDDFSTILNVLTAIHQEDEEYYEMCLRSYPDTE